MTTSEAIRELAQERLIPLFDAEKSRLDRIDRWYQWNPEPVRLPRGAEPELKYLADLSRTPYLNLVVTTVAQTLYLERLYSARLAPDQVGAIWAPWDNNGMHGKQIPLHRAALAYGQAYTLILPGDTGARITAHSPRESIAVYGDVVEDDFPQYFMRVIPQRNGRLFRIVDDEAVHFLSVEAGTDRAQYIEPRHHGLGYVPAVRYANQMDLEGRAPGEVEPFIPVAARINKTDHDRLLAQHFTSWTVRTATGLERPATDEDGRKQKMMLRHSDILTGEEGVEFGTLPGTPLEQFKNVRDGDVESLAATSQTPLTAFAKLINVSAEGLVEARASLYAKRDERQATFGQSHMQTLRTAAAVEGRDEDAQDFTLRAKWADTEIRTMQSAVDALGKAAQMLGVPAELLWDHIPNVDLVEAEAWRRYAADHPSPEMVQAQAFATQMRTTVDDG